jgi:hypothetical protein
MTKGSTAVRESFSVRQSWSATDQDENPVYCKD